MARAQFERSEVLDRSIELFWENGFSGSSMKQVANVTGLKPGSIYLAFENKEGLYREALQRYAEKSLHRIAKTLDDAPNVLIGICKLFDNLIEDARKVGYCSCFLIKTQLEITGEMSQLHAFASQKLADVEQLIKERLLREYSEEVSQERAVSVVLHIYGVRVYGYRQGSVESIRQGVCAGLPWLPWSEVNSL